MPGESTDPNKIFATGENNQDVEMIDLCGVDDGKSTDPGNYGKLTDSQRDSEMIDPGKYGESTDPKAAGESTDPGKSGKSTDPKAAEESTDPENTGETIELDQCGESTDLGNTGKTIDPESNRMNIDVPEPSSLKAATESSDVMEVDENPGSFSNNKKHWSPISIGICSSSTNATTPSNKLPPSKQEKLQHFLKADKKSTSLLILTVMHYQ